MSKIDLENSLFHAIRPYYMSQGYVSHFNVVSSKLEKVLKRGLIVSRECLKRELPSEDYDKLLNERYNEWQSQNSVSICCHPSNIEIVPFYYSDMGEGGTTAYETFIMNPNSLSIVLDINLIDELLHCYNGLRMIDEFQILDQIPLSYMKAIGIWVPLFKENSSEYVKRKLQISLNNNHSATIRRDIEKIYYQIQIIECLLSAYGYDKPVINICNGESFKDKEEQIAILAKKMNF